MKAGIAVDNWKLRTFRRMLSEAGYTYVDGGALTHDATLLTVETDDVLKLKEILEKCQAACRRIK